MVLFAATHPTRVQLTCADRERNSSGWSFGGPLDLCELHEVCKANNRVFAWRGCVCHSVCWLCLIIWLWFWLWVFLPEVDHGVLYSVQGLLLGAQFGKELLRGQKSFEFWAFFWPSLRNYSFDGFCHQVIESLGVGFGKPVPESCYRLPFPML